MVEATNSPSAMYDQRIEDLTSEIEVLAARLSRLSNLRFLMAFLVGAALLTGAITGSYLPPLIGLVPLVLFVLLVRQHRRTSAGYNHAAVAREMNIENLARIERDWEDLPIRHDEAVDQFHPYAADLDIFGKGSLFHLVDTVTTSMGELRLRNWLLGPAPATIASERQPAVQELAQMREWREEMNVIGRIEADDRPAPDEFLDWVESDTTLNTRGLLVWLARLGVVIMAGVILLAVAGVLPAAFIIFPALFNLTISFLARRHIGSRLEAAWSEHASINAYGSLLEHIDTQQFTSPLLAQLTSQLGTTDSPAHVEVGRLGTICNWVIPRSSLAYLPLQALACWDVHVLDSLETWQRKNGAHVREWLEIIGTIEALSSFGQLSFDNPAWVFPEINDSLESFDAESLGHPLIAEHHRVTNDVQVGPPGGFLLVTGSNMSGKSTLLRSIGINSVLSGAGGPVCASRLGLPAVELWTSVRVVDSLEQGVSFYMAELLRLRQIHVAAEEAATENRPFLYLLDEILQGTNSAERLIAARHVISRLVKLDAIGAVSTHDLELARGGELEPLAISIHFTDGVRDGSEGPEMHFDYTIRNGIARSTNALKLMQMVGFDLDDPAAEGVRNKQTRG